MGWEGRREGRDRGGEGGKSLVRLKGRVLVEVSGQESREQRPEKHRHNHVVIKLITNSKINPFFFLQNSALD